MGVDLGVEIPHIDISAVVAGHGHHLESGHNGGGGVGAVGGGGNEADVAAGFAAGVVVISDGEKARQLALGAGVGLQAADGEAGDVAEPGFEVGTYPAVALDLIGGGAGMDVGEFGQVTGIISAAALSFMVQEPREIML